MILKISLLVFLFTMFISCNNFQKNANNDIGLDMQRARLTFENKNNIMILPCVGCGCFKPALANAYEKDRVFFSSVFIYTDTSCTNFKFKTNQISQRALDSLNDNMYNLTLLKYENGEYKIRILSAKECGNLTKIAKSFFEYKD